MATRFFRIRSHREGSAGVLVAASSDLEWMSPGLDAAVFGTPNISPAFSDASLLDEFDVVDRKAQVRTFPIDLRLNGDEDTIAATQGELLKEIADCNEWGGTLRYRPDGMDYPVNLDILDISIDDGAGLWGHSAETFDYLTMRIVFSTQPWGYTDPLRIDDHFTSDTLAATGGIYNDGGADWTAAFETELLSLQQQGLEVAAVAATDWTDFDAAYTTITRSSAQAYAGTYSLSVAMDQNAGGAAITPHIGCAPSTPMSISARVRTSSANLSDVAGATLNFYDASGVLIGGGAGISTNIISPTNSGWTQVTGSGTSPANAVTCKLQLNYSGTGILIGDVAYWDDMHIVSSHVLADAWDHDGTHRIDAGQVYTSETRLVHSGSRWEYADPAVGIVFHPGDGESIGAKFGMILKWNDASNYVEAYVECTAASTWVVRVAKVVAGTRSVIYTSSSLGAITTRRRFDACMQGNRIYVSDPASAGVEGITPWQSMTYRATLTPAVDPQFTTGTRGRVGMVLKAMRSDANVSSFRAADGVVNVAAVTPKNSRLSAPIPTAASPLFELHVGMTGALPSRSFVGIGWWDRPRVLNHANADTIRYTTNWSNAIVAGVQAATGVAVASGSTPPATSFTANTIRLGASAASDAGGWWFDQRFYDAGKTYVLKADVKLNSGSGSMRAKLGVSGDQQIGNYTLSSSWQPITIEWTPNADAKGAYAAFVSNGTQTFTFDVANLRVYEATTSGEEPSSISGGYTALGAMPAVAGYDSLFGTITTDASSVFGRIITRSGAGEVGVAIPITTQPIEVPGDDLLVDYYVLCREDSTITSVTLKCYSNDVDAGTVYQYTEPFGSTGKPVGVRPSSGSNIRRWYYLGRIAIPRTDEQRYLVVSATVAGTGTFGLDTVVGIPADSSIVTPTAVPDDLLAKDMWGVVVEPDLRVATHTGQSRAARFGGAPLRMTSGMHPEFVVFSADAYIPDSTTSSSDSNAATESNRLVIAVPRPRVYLNEAVNA